MNHTEFFKSLKNNNINPPYIFTGVEEYVKDKALAALKSKIITSDLEQLNYKEAEGKGFRYNDLINSTETLPFMSQWRLMVLKDASWLIRKKAAEETDVAAYIEKMPDTTCVVFFCRGDAKKTALHSAVKKYGNIVEFAKLNVKEMRSWVRKAFKAHKKKITNATIDYLVDLTGDDLYHLTGEIEKAAAFAGDEEIIQAGHIKSVVTPSLEENIFRMLDAIGQRDSDTAIIILNDILSGKKNPMEGLGVFQMIVRQLRMILRCKLFSREGLNINNMKNQLNIRHDFLIRKYLNQGRNFAENKLVDTLSYCAELDRMFKNGNMELKTGVELVVVRMCSLG